MLQKRVFFLIAVFYASVEKKNSVRCLLKTKWLMKRQLVKGSNLLNKHLNKCFVPSCFVRALGKQGMETTNRL